MTRRESELYQNWLKTGADPQVERLVDLKRFKYVCKSNWQIATFLGVTTIPRGLLSDGMTGVPDNCKEGLFFHDGKYLVPYINGRRVGKFMIDLALGEILFRNWQILTGIAYPLGLQFGFSLKFGLKIHLGAWKAWRDHRHHDGDPDWIEQHMFPRQDLWRFPSYNIKDAVWLGPSPL